MTCRLAAVSAVAGAQVGSGPVDGGLALGHGERRGVAEGRPEEELGGVAQGGQDLLGVLLTGDGHRDLVLALAGHGGAAGTGVDPVVEDGDDGVQLGLADRAVGLVDDGQAAVEVEAELGRPTGGQGGAQGDGGDGDHRQQADPQGALVLHRRQMIGGPSGPPGSSPSSAVPAVAPGAGLRLPVVADRLRPRVRSSWSSVASSCVVVSSWSSSVVVVSCPRRCSCVVVVVVVVDSPSSSSSDDRLDLAEDVLAQDHEGGADAGLEGHPVAVDVDDVAHDAAGGQDLVAHLVGVALLPGRLGLALLGPVDEEVERGADDHEDEERADCPLLDFFAVGADQRGDGARAAIIERWRGGSEVGTAVRL